MHNLRLEKTGTRDPSAGQHMQQLHHWRGGSGPQQMLPAGICAQKQVRLHKIIDSDTDNCQITVVLAHSLFVWYFRAKVKTVTFLLPVDDIYTNRPVLSKDQNGSKITELASISETDS